MPTPTSAAPPAGTVPLVVDLDGTLVRTDTLHESFLRAAKRNPLLLVLAPLWLLKGKARLKAEVGRRVELDASRLPYSEPLLAFLLRGEERGATAGAGHGGGPAHRRRRWRRTWASSPGVASDGAVNLRGARKLERLKETLPGVRLRGQRRGGPAAVARGARGGGGARRRAGVVRKVPGRAGCEVRVFEAPRRACASG